MSVLVTSSCGARDVSTVVRAERGPRFERYVEPDRPGAPSTSPITGLPVCQSGMRRGST